MLLWGTFQKYGEAPKLSLDDMAKVQAITQNYTKRAKSTSRRFKRSERTSRRFKRGERTSYDSNTNTKNVNRHFKIHKNRRLWLQNTHRRRLITQKRAKRTSLVGCLDNCMTEQLCGKYYLYYEWTRKYSVLKWAKNNNNNNTFGTKERKFWTFFFRVKSIELCKIVIDLGVYLQ